MCPLIPLTNERKYAVRQSRFVGEIHDAPPLALEDAEPLLRLVHPSAMYRSVIPDKTWMARQPVLNLLAYVHPHIIQNHSDHADARKDLVL